MVGFVGAVENEEKMTLKVFAAPICIDDSGVAILALYGGANSIVVISVVRVVTSPDGDVYVIASRKNVLALSVGAILLIWYSTSHHRVSNGILVLLEENVNHVEMKSIGSEDQRDHKDTVEIIGSGIWRRDIVPVYAILSVPVLTLLPYVSRGRRVTVYASDPSAVILVPSIVYRVACIGHRGAVSCSSQNLFARISDVEFILMLGAHGITCTHAYWVVLPYGSVKVNIYVSLIDISTFWNIQPIKVYNTPHSVYPLGWMYSDHVPGP